MEKAVRLNEDQIDDILGTLTHWRLKDGKLHRELRFADFSEAFAFMTRVALVAERMDHHPDWSNGYSKVTIDLMTHDAGGITRKDVDLARAIDRIAGSGGSAA
jgi:4a-hydroxytetrahydrobiopterin dehydratase